MKQQNESVKKLEVGKDYVNVNDNNLIVIDRVGDFDNKGFYEDLYKKDIPCTSCGSWRESTEEEVIEAFERHLIHRYGEDWETMKIKENHPYSSLEINNGSWELEIVKSSVGWNVWNVNGLLYCNGIWVERLEEKKTTDWTTSPKDFKYKKIKFSTNVDKKRYEVIKTTLSDFKQVSLGDNKTNKVIAHFVEQGEETLTLAEKIVDILNLIEK